MKSKLQGKGTWLIILIMMIALVGQQIYFSGKYDGGSIRLGKEGTETFYDGEIPKETREKSKDNIGVSIPASLSVVDNKARITIKNTGRTTIIPSVKVNEKEVYRASKELEPGKTVAAIIPVGQGASKCVTLIEAVDGGKFTVTSKLER